MGYAVGTAHAYVNMDAFITDYVKDNNLLSKLQTGNQVWNHEKHVQSWIDRLNDSCVLLEENEFIAKKYLSESDVFLQLPGYNDDDDLELGAEAKHYGPGNHSILSPRLSPICSFEDKEVEQHCNGSYAHENDNKTDSCVPSSPGLTDSDLKALVEAKSLIKPSSINDEISDVEPEVVRPMFQKGFSLDSYSTHDSSVSIDKPASLAAALRTDPEELLYNLGFVSASSSLLTTIPSRFFQGPSAAFGIDVEGIHMALLEEEYQSMGESLSDTKEMNPINHPRFSQSSIDNPNIQSASSRRLLFHSSSQDMPSIYVAQDENDCPNTPTTTTSSSIFSKKLETLEEVPEPNSRSSSFDNNNQTSISLTETMSNVAGRLYDFVKRRTSEASTAREDTLTDDQQIENNIDDGDSAYVNSLTQNNNVRDTQEESNLDVLEENLKLPCSRVSSKSSLATVIDVSELDEGVKFRPISADQPGVENTPENTKHQCTAENKRMLFKEKKSKTIRDSDGVFINKNDSVVSNEPRNISQDEGSEQDSLVSSTISNSDTKQRKTSNKSINHSLKNVFRNIGKSLLDSNNDDIEVQIILTPPNHKQSQSIYLKWDEEGNNLVESTNQNSLLESFLKIFSNLVGKSNDTKLSTCDQEVAQINQSDCRNNSQSNVRHHSQSNVRHSSQSECRNNSQSNGRNRSQSSLPDSEDDPPVSNKNLTINDITTEETNSKTKNENFNDFKRNSSSKESNLSNKFLSLFTKKRNSNLTNNLNFKSLPVGLDQVGTKDENHSSSKLNNGDKSPEINGFERSSTNNAIPTVNNNHNDNHARETNDTHEIRCPLGKNCSINHGVHNSCRSIGKGLPNGNSNNTREQSMDSDSIFLTHDHFDYIVKEISVLRNDIVNINYQHSLREKELIKELKRILEKEHSKQYEELQKEIDSLKRKIQAKDNEIGRLNTLLKSEK